LGWCESTIPAIINSRVKTGHFVFMQGLKRLLALGHVTFAKNTLTGSGAVLGRHFVFMQGLKHLLALGQTYLPM
jgi:hypothetical protein